MRKIYNYPVLVDCEEGVYIASCPAFPGCVAQAKTYEKALKEISEGIEVFIETYHKKHWPLPDATPPAFTLVSVAINE